VLTSKWYFIARKFGESSEMGTQMIRYNGVRSSTSTDNTWRSIDWQKARREVRRLQMRIAKAVKEGKHGRVKSLQWTLTHSFYAKALAVKRVTSNKGKKTPGIDGVLWKTASAKM
jgi:RNA-directed DNA polymerase